MISWGQAVALELSLFGGLSLVVFTVSAAWGHVKRMILST